MMRVTLFPFSLDRSGSSSSSSPFPLRPVQYPPFSTQIEEEKRDEKRNKCHLQPRLHMKEVLQFQDLFWRTSIAQATASKSKRQKNEILLRSCKKDFLARPMGHTYISRGHRKGRGGREGGKEKSGIMEPSITAPPSSISCSSPSSPISNAKAERPPRPREDPFGRRRANISSFLSLSLFPLTPFHLAVLSPFLPGAGVECRCGRRRTSVLAALIPLFHFGSGADILPRSLLLFFSPCHFRDICHSLLSFSGRHSFPPFSLNRGSRVISPKSPRKCDVFPTNSFVSIWLRKNSGIPRILNYRKENSHLLRSKGGRGPEAPSCVEELR